jgi:hypothetical protein
MNMMYALAEVGRSILKARTQSAVVIPFPQAPDRLASCIARNHALDRAIGPVSVSEEDSETSWVEVVRSGPVTIVRLFVRASISPMNFKALADEAIVASGMRVRFSDVLGGGSKRHPLRIFIARCVDQQ